MLKLFSPFAFILGVQVWLVEGECTAVGNSSDPNPCIFPFVHKKRIYDKCTSANGDKPWCATSVDLQSKIPTMKKWGYCTSNCPGVLATTPPIIHAPENDVGNCYCGVVNIGVKKRIVGGDKVQPGGIPWQVALLNNSHNPEDQYCGGTLVGDRYVITAAHCTEMPESEIKVLIGATSLGVLNETTRLIRRINKKIVNPGFLGGFEGFMNGSDITVLKLDVPVDLRAYPNIKPACLPVHITRQELFGKRAIVSGWGFDQDSMPYTHSDLRQAGIKIRKDCDQTAIAAAEGGFNLADRLCANDEGKSACRFDSGGGLLVRDNKDNNGAYTLVGAVNGGTTCEEYDTPGTFVDITYHIDWLRETMEGQDMNTCPPPPKLRG